MYSVVLSTYYTHLEDTVKKLILVSALVLSGCNTSYINKEIDREGQWLKVKVERTESTSFTRKEGFKRKGKAGEATYYLNDPTNECMISVMSKGIIKLDDIYALTLGHELMHCLYGDYHD